LTSRHTFLGLSLLSFIPVAAAQYGCRGDVILGGPDSDGGPEATVFPEASDDGGNSGDASDAGSPGDGASACPGFPVFSPGAGSYAPPLAVAITAPNLPSDGTIFYTTDGSVPSANSFVYTQPIQVTTSETLVAMASAPGCPILGYTTAPYTLPNTGPVTATPTFSPPGGVFCAPQSVTITDTTPGATIFYTTDGTNPTAASTVYVSPVTTFLAITQMRAIATAPGYATSGVGVGTYTIDSNPGTPAPTISPASGVQNNDFLATLSVPSAGGALCYTLDGSTPTGAGACTGSTLTYDAASSIRIDGTVTSPTTGQVTLEAMNSPVPCANGCCNNAYAPPVTYTLQVD